jgi:hypothetical protein
MKPRGKSLWSAQTPALTPSSGDAASEFVTQQELKLAEYGRRLAVQERRTNGQQVKIAHQDKLIATLQSENRALRVRLRFVENATELLPQEESKSVALKLRGGPR